MENNKSNNQLIIAVIVTAVLVGAGAFYVGTLFAGEGSSANSNGGNRGNLPEGITQEDMMNLRGLSPEEREQRMQELGFPTDFGSDRPANGGAFALGRAISGEIISMGNDSFTIKLEDGSTRIVLFESSTEVATSQAGTVDDLVEGKEVFISGDANSDGSYNADSVQIQL